MASGRVKPASVALVMCISTWEGSQNWQNMGERMNWFPSGCLFECWVEVVKKGYWGCLSGGVGRRFVTWGLAGTRKGVIELDGARVQMLRKRGARRGKGWEALGASVFGPLGHAVKVHQETGWVQPHPAQQTPRPAH